MKNHIVFKFIAIVLCAASLLGAVGSGLGIFAMTEMGLYDRSVEEAYETYVEGYVDGLAIQILERYTSMNLGGTSSQLADSMLGNYWSSSVFDMSRVGYTIWDENGNAVQEQTLYEGYPVEQTFLFDSTDGYNGSYIRVVSETPQETYAPTLAEGVITNIGEDYVYNAIPAEGAEVYSLQIDSDDGSEGIASHGESLGTIFQMEDGTVVFSYEADTGVQEILEERFPTYICFWTMDGQVIYEASSPDGVMDEGRWNIESGGQLTLRNLEGQVRVYDAIPAGGCYVSRVSVSYDDDFSESAGGAPSIGYLNYDENGYVRYLADEGVLTYSEAPVTNISFYDENGSLVYRAYDPDGVGMFYQEDGIYFLADMLGSVQYSIEPAAEENIFRYVSDAVPELPSDGVDVYKVEYWDADNDDLMLIRGTKAALGTVFWNAYGDIVFQCPGLFGTHQFETVYICLYDENDEPLFESYCTDAEIGEGGPIGQFTFDDNGDMIFTTDLTYTAPDVSYEVMAATEAPAEIQPEITGLAETMMAAPVYSGPSTKSDALSTLQRGETVEIVRVETPDNTQWALTNYGWIQMEYLALVEEPVVASEETIDSPEETEAVEETVVPTEEVEWTEVVEDGTPATEPVAAASYKTADGYETYSYYDYVSGQRMVVEYVYEDMPAYTVTVQLAQGALSYEYEWVLLRLLYAYQSDLPMVIGFCLLMFAIMAVYLCCAAGRKPGTTEIRPAGLNCIPLDLYAVAAVSGVVLLAVGGMEGTRYLVQRSTQVGLLFLLLMGCCASLLVVGFCFACAAQFKTPGGFWWRNSLCGWCLRGIAACWKWFVKVLRKFSVKEFCKGVWRILVAVTLFGKRFLLGLFDVVKKLWLWLWTLVKKCVGKLGKTLNRFFSMLPVTWQWLLVGFIMFLLMVMVSAANGEEVLVVIYICACIGIIVYGAHCFGVLLEAAKRMSKGDLDEKVDDKLLTGSFKEFAGELNGLADVAVVAAQKQLKSERMKTELITNVSHDIKTPLTSIINYVDLLQKPHTAEEQAAYLEVLDRQSQRLKKLIDDLMEMSKASTGNLVVDISKVDAAEAINQSLGEFSDKLAKADLTPVFRQPDEPITMMADGRLVWRVMSNLLGNAVKYALPGTRVYLDLVQVDGKVIISMKNISREELNVNADELLERFVRGDASRNTEGSGLGLNIAQSLMELQKGQLQLLVDGDLFKVTLIFPGT